MIFFLTEPSKKPSDNFMKPHSFLGVSITVLLKSIGIAHELLSVKFGP